MLFLVCLFYAMEDELIVLVASLCLCVCVCVTIQDE